MVFKIRKGWITHPYSNGSSNESKYCIQSAADRMSAKELEGKIVVGEFANKQKDEFTQGIENISVEKSGKKTLINSAYESEL